MNNEKAHQELYDKLIYSEAIDLNNLYKWILKRFEAKQQGGGIDFVKEFSNNPLFRAKEWDNKVIEHLHSLDIADFYLEIYASRDTFSRAKIMEMFRDYHIHKLSNIKEVMQEKLDESKDELNDPMLNSGALGYFEGRETVLTELLKTL